ncbi:MAG: hypothetical protein AAGE52_31305 [Myxococcota bacterium]
MSVKKIALLVVGGLLLALGAYVLHAAYKFHVSSKMYADGAEFHLREAINLEQLPGDRRDEVDTLVMEGESLAQMAKWRSETAARNMWGGLGSSAAGAVLVFFALRQKGRTCGQT